MLSFLIRRTGQALVVISVMMVLVFFGVNIIGDPIWMLIPPDMDQEAIEATAASLGLDKPIWEQGVVLAIVGVAITVLVYGVVALIVKMDDIGLVLAQRSTAMVRMIGRGLVKGMPIIMRTLAIVGTAAMLWVGGQIIVHGLETFHISEPAHSFHAAAHWVAGMTGPLGGLFDWLVNATLAGIFGLVIGAIIAFVVTRIANARNGSAAGGKAA